MCLKLLLWLVLIVINDIYDEETLNINGVGNNVLIELDYLS